MKERYFSIKHKKCGSTFTINAKIFLSTVDVSERKMLVCPSCGIIVKYPNKIVEIIDAYDKFDKLIDKVPEENGKFTIKEISEDVFNETE